MNNAKNTTLFPYLERLLDGEEVEWKTLGEVAEFKRGQSITQKTAQEGVYPVISGGQQSDGANYHCCRFGSLCRFCYVLERTDIRFRCFFDQGQ